MRALRSTAGVIAGNGGGVEAVASATGLQRLSAADVGRELRRSADR